MVYDKDLRNVFVFDFLFDFYKDKRCELNNVFNELGLTDSEYDVLNRLLNGLDFN